MSLHDAIRSLIRTNGYVGFLSMYLGYGGDGPHAAPWHRRNDAGALKAQADECWGEGADVVLSYFVDLRERRRNLGIEYKIYLDEGQCVGDGVRLYRRTPSVEQLLVYLSVVADMYAIEVYRFVPSMDEGAILFSNGAIARFQRSPGNTFRIFALEGPAGHPDRVARQVLALRNSLEHVRDAGWLRKHLGGRFPWDSWLADR
ncbi:hypothetical protein HH110_01525 [Stenotrophomonas sp. SAM-B]|uniref:hypothetical protein n=1 Tax=Stenotrophomonas sp. SAM-B TaxID=2729141 RepID=UPI0015A06926|nr:hypothetical protein [Stenotrophomonas sp. SAM-B]NWF31721.1 hypothetical protein [Stenotrophomonas sp. SAM-B]